MKIYQLPYIVYVWTATMYRTCVKLCEVSDLSLSLSLSLEREREREREVRNFTQLDTCPIHSCCSHIDYIWQLIYLHTYYIYSLYIINNVSLCINIINLSLCINTIISASWLMVLFFHRQKLMLWYVQIILFTFLYYDLNIYDIYSFIIF